MSYLKERYLELTDLKLLLLDMCPSTHHIVSMYLTDTHLKMRVLGQIVKFPAAVII